MRGGCSHALCVCVKHRCTQHTVRRTSFLTTVNCVGWRLRLSQVLPSCRSHHGGTAVCSPHRLHPVIARGGRHVGRRPVRILRC